MEQGLDIADITEKLESTTLMVWGGFCNKTLERIEALPAGSENLVVKAACTHILGGFFGSVSIEVEKSFLERMAKHMLREEEVSIEDMNSVAREFVNVISGNLKVSLSPEHSILSAPKDFEQVGFGFTLPDSEAIATVVFKSLNGMFVVKLHQATRPEIGL